MTDIVDIATVEISREMESKLGRRKFRFRALKRSRQFCAECGEPIPKERQQAAVFVLIVRKKRKEPNMQYDKELYQNVGKIMGTLESMDKRLSRIEKRQDEAMKKVARNSMICSGVFSVMTAVVIAKLKSMTGM